MRQQQPTKLPPQCHRLVPETWPPFLLLSVLLSAVWWMAGPPTASAGSALPPSVDNRRILLPVVIDQRSICGSAPCLLQPADGAAVDTLLPSFTWDAGLQDGISQLHICPTAQIPCGSCYPSCPGASGPGVHTVRPAENLPARKVWWAVELQYFDAQGAPHDVLSTVRSLDVVGDLPVPSAPVLIGPSGTVTQTTLSFSWKPVVGALDYKLCYWGPKGWPCLTTTATAKTLTFPALEQEYPWFVEARNNYGYSSHNELRFHIKLSTTSPMHLTAR